MTRNVALERVLYLERAHDKALAYLTPRVNGVEMKHLYTQTAYPLTLIDFVLMLEKMIKANKIKRVFRVIHSELTFSDYSDFMDVPVTTLPDELHIWISPVQ